jgi:hypothetical protein
MNEAREFAYLKTVNAERQPKFPTLTADRPVSIRRVRRGTMPNNVARLGNVAHQSGNPKTGNKAARLVDLVRESTEPKTGRGGGNISQLSRVLREGAKSNPPNAADRLQPTRFRQV